MRNPQTQRTSPSQKPVIKPLDMSFLAEKEKPKPTKESSNSWFSKKLYRVYGIIWLYFIIKVFVVDIEAWLLESVGLEQYQLFLGLRIFIIPCLLAIFIAKRGYKFVLRHIFHFLTVPFYFTVFLFIKVFYDNWVVNSDKQKNPTLLVFLLEVLGRFLSRLNYYLFSAVGLTTLTICLFYPTNKPIQIASLLMGAALAITLMYQSLLKAVQPLRIFGFFKIDDIIAFENKRVRLSRSQDKSKPKTRFEIIRELLFAHILMSILQKSVVEIREKKSFLFVALADFFLLLIAISAYFAFVNYNLFLIAPQSFTGISNPHLGDFAFYAFYALAGEGTSLEPINWVSKLIKVVTTCYGYFLFIFLATTLWGVYSEKFTKALEATYNFLQAQSRVSEPKLSAMLGIPIDVFKQLSFEKLWKILNELREEQSKAA